MASPMEMLNFISVTTRRLIMPAWDDWFRNFYLNEDIWNNTSFPRDYYQQPQSPKTSGFLKNLTETLEDINRLLVALFDNSLPKAQILNEKITIDDDGMFHLELVVLREGEDKPRTFKVNVQELLKPPTDDDEDEDEETTDYFTE